MWSHVCCESGVLRKLCANFQQRKLNFSASQGVANRDYNEAIFSSQKKFLQYPSHQMFRHMHEVHYYRIGLCSRPFVPTAFGPGTKDGFCPGSNG